MYLNNKLECWCLGNSQPTCRRITHNENPPRQSVQLSQTHQRLSNGSDAFLKIELCQLNSSNCLVEESQPVMLDNLLDNYSMVWYNCTGFTTQRNWSYYDVSLAFLQLNGFFKAQYENVFTSW